MTITSYANRTSPVNRGKWVLENLLAAPPPPPPPNVPALKTEGNTTGKPLTMRDAMVQHRANPVCASCHARMDPIGFAMENFDPVGRWRDRDAGSRIDASGVFPDGQTFDGHGRAESGVAQPAGGVRLHGHGKAADVRPRPQRPVFRSAGRPRDCQPKRAQQLHLRFARAGRREERSVPDAGNTTGGGDENR